jgi:hypothetical protein
VNDVCEYLLWQVHQLRGAVGLGVCHLGVQVVSIDRS